MLDLIRQKLNVRKCIRNKMTREFGHASPKTQNLDKTGIFCVKLSVIILSLFSFPGFLIGLQNTHCGWCRFGCYDTIVFFLTSLHFYDLEIQILATKCSESWTVENRENITDEMI